MHRVVIIGVGVISVWLAGLVSALAQNLTQQKEALKVITETAADICYTVQQQGNQSETQLSGEVQAKLNGVIARLADLGIKGTGEQKSKEYQGVLQEQLSSTLAHSADCKKDVFDKLVEKILPQQMEQRRQPTFSENLEKVGFSLGEGGFTVRMLRSDLESRPREPFDFGGFKPVKVYVADGALYADVEIYGGAGIAAIKIQKNQLINRPDSWDMNSNDQALEVVNENAAVVYQFYYKSPSHIVFNGIFPIPGGLILASDSEAALNPKLPATFSLKRIFRYPSWKYPGQIDETEPTTTVVVSSSARR